MSYLHECLSMVIVSTEDLRTHTTEDRMSPHWYPDGTGKGIRIVEADMTPEEIEEYREGYENETDRKDWG
jgi:hypothetical protein